MGIMGVLTVIFAIASIASIGVIGNSDQVFAGGLLSCESDADGPWESADTWNDDCNDEGIPGEFQHVLVQHEVTISTDIVNSEDESVEIDEGGVLTVENGASLTTNQLFVNGGDDPMPTLIIEYGGTVDADEFINEGDTFNHGTLNVDIFVNSIFDTFHNQCTGVVNIASNGGNDRDFLIINHGIFNVLGFFANFGLFQNSGEINGGFLNFDDGELQSIPSICLVGGELFPINTTALLLAGIQTNALWIMSTLAIIGSVAFSAVYITVKRN